MGTTQRRSDADFESVGKVYKIYDHKSKVFCCYPPFSTTFKESLSSNFFQVNFIAIFSTQIRIHNQICFFVVQIFL